MFRQICRDERTWNDPGQFLPERFLAKGGANTEVLDPRDIIFGHGRRWVVVIWSHRMLVKPPASFRICPGRQFADATLFLAIANIVATLDIQKALDTKGKAVTPRVSFTDTFVRSVADAVCVTHTPGGLCCR